MEPVLGRSFDELMVCGRERVCVHNPKFNCASRKGTLSTPTIFPGQAGHLKNSKSRQSDRLEMIGLIYCMKARQFGSVSRNLVEGASK
jgi:hypothetical protein